MPPKYKFWSGLHFGVFLQFLAIFDGSNQDFAFAGTPADDPEDFRLVNCCNRQLFVYYSWLGVGLLRIFLYIFLIAHIQSLSKARRECEWGGSPPPLG